MLASPISIAAPWLVDMDPARETDGMQEEESDREGHAKSVRRIETR